MTAYIGQENLLSDADSVTASNELSGFEVSNVYDFTTITWWKPGVLNSPQEETIEAVFSSSQTINYFGVMSHNIGTEGATIALQYNTSSPRNWTTLFTITPSTDKSIFRYSSTGATASEWRILITGSTVDLIVGIINIGSAIALPEPIKPPHRLVNFNYKNKYLTSITDGGQFAGRSKIEKGVEVLINQRDVDKSWIDSNYDTLFSAIELTPFFFSYDYENYPDVSAYVWVDGEISAPSRDSLYAVFSIPCRGLIE